MTRCDFKIYKQTSPKDGWEEKRNKLIAELKSKKRGYYTGISIDDLAKIYIEEQMIDELFEIVSSSNSIHTIIKYTSHLKSKYPADMATDYNVGDLRGMWSITIAKKKVVQSF